MWHITSNVHITMNPTATKAIPTPAARTELPASATVRADLIINATTILIAQPSLQSDILVHVVCY